MRENKAGKKSILVLSSVKLLKQANKISAIWRKRMCDGKRKESDLTGPNDKCRIRVNVRKGGGRMRMLFTKNAVTHMKCIRIPV